MRTIRTLALGVVAFALANLGVGSAYWLLQEQPAEPLIWEVSGPSEELIELRRIQPRISFVVADLAASRISLGDAVELLSPLIYESALRHGLQITEGRSEAEKLARMVFSWAKMKNDEAESNEAEQSTARLSAELHSLFPDSAHPPALAVRSEPLQ